MSEVLSLTSTVRKAYAAMALICFTVKMISRCKYFYGMGGQRTRFPSTSEVVYKVPPDMSMLCYFILWRGDAVVKGIKRKRVGGDTRKIDHQIFSHRYLYYVTPPGISGIFLSRGLSFWMSQ